MIPVPEFAIWLVAIAAALAALSMIVSMVCLDRKDEEILALRQRLSAYETAEERDVMERLR